MEPTMDAGAVSDTKSLGAVVQIEDGKIRAHLDEVVRATVEETLNALLDAEADVLCGARKYERTEDRKDTRAGSYDRQLHTKAAEIVANGIEETLSYYQLPPEHWRCLRTNNPLERLMREIRRRTRVVGSFPDGNSVLMLVAARLRHVASTRWGIKRYLQMKRLAEVVT
jgi:transposase-like protein